MPHRMPRRSLGLSLAAIAVSAGITVGIAPLVANADQPRTAAEARVRVQQLQAEQAVIDRQYTDQQQRVATILGDVDEKAAEITRLDAKIAKQKTQLAQVVLAQYQNQGVDPTAQMIIAGDPSQFLSSIATMDKVAQNQAAMLAQFQADQANANDLRRAREAESAKAQQDVKKLQDLDQQSRAKVAEAQRVVDQLTAEEKAKYEAELAAQRKAQADAAAAAAAQAAQRQAAQAAAQQAAQAAAQKAAQPVAPAQPAPVQAAPAQPAAAQPAAAQQAPAQPAPAQPVQQTQTQQTQTSTAQSRQSSQATAPTVSTAGGNLYSYGTCTWYAYNRRAAMGRPVGNNWGNASAWPGNAAAAGFSVGSRPAVGAVMISYAGGAGHASIVEQVGSDGSVVLSEMNWWGNGGGFGIVSSRTLTAAQAAGYTFIY